MTADTMFFFGDLLHASNGAAIISSSGNAAGYSSENVRDTNLMTAWKDSDSLATDVWLKADGGSTTWIGAAGDTAYCAIAYDSRDNEQDTLLLQYGTVDDGAFAAPNTVATFTLTKLGTGVKCQWKSFTIPGTAKRYWRLFGSGGARTEATGTKVPKVYAWSMYDKDTVYALSTSFPNDAPGGGQHTPFTRAGVARTAVGALAANKFAEYGQRFDTTFQPASVALWKAVRDQLGDQGGPLRANFVQWEGLRNSDQEHVFLCRVQGNDYQGGRQYVDNYESGLTWETEPWL